MPRGGNHRRLQPTNPKLTYARLLMEAMHKDSTPAGAKFRAELDLLLRRYDRLVSAMSRHPVSGWTYGPNPPIEHMRMWFECLLLPTPIPYPRPTPLSEPGVIETERRRRLAGVVSMKVHRRAREVRGKTQAALRARLRRADQAAWNWALELARHANPQWGNFRESGRIQVRRYLSDVDKFSDRWRLAADWAPLTIIDRHFMRVLHGFDAFLPIVTTSDWAGESVPIVVMIPGADRQQFARDRERFTTCRVELEIPGPTPFTVNWTPDQGEQQAYERRENSSCVVFRWEGEGFGAERNSILPFFERELAFRLGRPLTKSEVRETLRQIDPQIREAREEFRSRGWHVATDAPLSDHAAWLARRLLTHATWDEVAAAYSPPGSVRGLEPAVVRRACTEFAAVLELRLPSPARRPRGKARA